MDLIYDVFDAINRYGMLEKDDRVLIGLSGGPDSVFLTYALMRLRRKLGVKIFIAHLDHGTRGKASRRDARFAKRMAETLGLKIICKKSPPVKSRSKLSPEEILREKRYAFFKKSAGRLKTSVVATAHTLDDQAETVMMRVIKGASLKGIVGIHIVRKDAGIKFIRPLIGIEKKDILKYLKKKKIPFVTDHTNLENRFLRNRVRNRILPYLARVNPRIKRSLFNLAETLREDFEFIEAEKRKRQGLVKTKKSSSYILLRDILLQPKALQKELVREALKSINANIKKLTFRHWQDIDRFVRTKVKGKSIDLPGKVKMRKTSDRLLFTSSEPASPDAGSEEVVK